MFDYSLKIIFNKTVNESNSSNTKNETVNKINSSTKNKTVNKSNNNTKNKTVNESNSNTKNESKSKTVNKSNNNIKNKTVNESNSNTKNESKSNNKCDYESDNEGDNLTNKDKNYYKIKQINNWFKIIDRTKSLEEQIEILKTKDFLYEYWPLKYYNDNKYLNYKIFKVKAAYLLTDLDKEIFKKVYNCDFIVLVEKLINTVDKKEENQITTDDIKNNRSKIFKIYSLDKNMNKPAGDSDDTAKIILELNEVLISDKVNNNNNYNNNDLI